VQKSSFEMSEDFDIGRITYYKKRVY